MDSEFVVRLVWLFIGLGLGYAIGAASTAVQYGRRLKQEQARMRVELHQCHMILHDERNKRDATG